MANAPAPISVQLYSLRKEAAKDFVGVLARLGEIGFVGVELAGFNGLTPAQFSKAATDAGLVVSSGHIGDTSPDAVNSALDDLQAVGADTAVLAVLAPATFGDLEQINRAADALNTANEIARVRGVTVGYHNHYWEFQTVIDDKAAWWHFFDRLDETIVAELDMYWAKVGGADPIDVVTEMGARVRLLHVKDGPAQQPEQPMVAAGKGLVDIGGVLAASASAVAWHIVELDRCETDMMQAVADSYNYLVGNGLSRGRR